MNKSLLVTVLTLLWGIAGKAQNDLYKFSHTTATYANVPSMQKVNPAGYPATVEDFVLPLPFDFMLYDKTFNSVTLSSNGLLVFVETSSSKVRAILTLGPELKNFSTSASGVFTETTGSTGNRIFIIEFRDMGIYFGNASDFVNFQVWLYEGRNNIEMHYGPRTNFDLDAYDSEEGPSVGIISIDTATFQVDTSYYLTGNSTSPVFNADEPDIGNPFFISGHIAANTVYRFTRKGSATASIKGVDAAAQGFTVFPNPSAGGKVSVHFDNPLALETNLTLMDMNGREIICQAVPAESTLAEINTGGLAPGVYVLKTGGLAWQKVIIN